MLAFQACDPGSIPGQRIFTLFLNINTIYFKKICIQYFTKSGNFRIKISSYHLLKIHLIIIYLQMDLLTFISIFEKCFNLHGKKIVKLKYSEKQLNHNNKIQLMYHT